MSDHDLIRRGDALAAVSRNVLGSETARKAIAALPAAPAVDPAQVRAEAVAGAFLYIAGVMLSAGKADGLAWQALSDATPADAADAIDRIRAEAVLPLEGTVAKLADLHRAEEAKIKRLKVLVRDLTANVRRWKSQAKGLSRKLDVQEGATRILGDAVCLIRRDRIELRRQLSDALLVIAQAAGELDIPANATVAEGQRRVRMAQATLASGMEQRPVKVPHG